MRNYLAAVAAVGFAVAATSPVQAGITYYTDRAVFLADLGFTSTEDFSDATLVTGLSFLSTLGHVTGGIFDDEHAAGFTSTTFSFAGGSKGFGGNFDLSPGGLGAGVAFALSSGDAVTQQIPRTNTGEFFGFISTDSFNSVTITAGNQAGLDHETNELDDLSFGGIRRAGAGAVPEPASWALMLGGFGAIGGALRSRRKAAVSFG